MQLKTRSQIEREKTDREISEATCNSLRDDKVCQLCGKRFERRAVLATHSKMCQKEKTSTRAQRRAKRGRANAKNSPPEAVQLVVTNGCDPSEIRAAPLTPMIKVNKRKRGRAMKYVSTENPVDSDEDDNRPLIMHKTDADEPKIKMKKMNGERRSRSKAKAEEDIDVDQTEIKAEPIAKTPMKMHKKDRRAKDKLAASQCEYCLKHFSNTSNLRRHITTSHIEPAKFSCDLCTGDEVFRARRKTEVIGHMRSEHNFQGERSDAVKYIASTEDSTDKLANGMIKKLNDNGDDDDEDEDVADDADNDKDNNSTSTDTSVNNKSNKSNNSNPRNDKKCSNGIGMNRRKDRHTDVLKDDIEMFFADDNGDFAIDEQKENGSVDGTDAHANGTENESSTCMKRKGRPKANGKSKDADQSSSEKDGTESLLSGRPVRNRRQRVKTDFVYNLSAVIKQPHYNYKDFQIEVSRVEPEEQPLNEMVPVKESQSTSESPSTSTSKTSSPAPSPPPPSQPHDHLSQNDEVKEEMEDPSPIEHTSNKSLPEDDAQPEQLEQEPEEEIVEPVQKAQSPLPDEKSMEDIVRGSAARMAQSAVDMRNASFSLALFYLTDSVSMALGYDNDEAAKQSSSVHRVRVQRMRTNNRIHVPGLKRKKCVHAKCKPLNHVCYRAPTNGHADGAIESSDTKSEPIKIADLLLKEVAQFQASQQLNGEKRHEMDQLSPSPSSSPSPPPAPTLVSSTTAAAVPLSSTPIKAAESASRRITLVERMNENKNKKLCESLTQLSIAGASENESEEEDKSD